jgi:WD40 repeat protein
MLCCLNPTCKQPHNAKPTEVCESCGTPLEPRLRGRYRPLRLIGWGGFGRTYLAVDTDRLNARCVIKQFAPQRQGTKSLQKAEQLFEQEAMRLHELGEHPQIPTLLAYFENRQHFYLVQQMIPGRTLFQELADQGAFDDSKIRQLLADILPVLRFIHGQGVIHRDITPTNIIRHKLDQRLILIDFGVAKQFSDAILYEPGTRIGTEGYAPLEQLRNGQAYPSSDIYGLGATCLHLLTNCKPESLYSPIEGRWVWEDKLMESGRTVDAGLAKVLNCMVKDLLSERYQSAQDVLDDLRRLPTLQGSVPGWGSSGTSATGSLFDQLSRPPVSGPGETAGFSLPKTVPPQPSGSARVSRPLRSDKPLSPPPAKPISIPSRGTARQPTRSSPGISAEGQPWQPVKELTGHHSWVTTVAFNPKLPNLVSGSLDDTIRVWNWQTGQLLFSLSGHARGVNHVVIGAGGQVLASCGDDDVVRVWNLATGSLIHTLSGHMRDVTSVAIGQKGFLLASASEDRTIKVWTLDRGNLVKTLTGSVSMIKTVTLFDNDQRLVSGGMDNKVRLWNLQTGELVKVLVGHVNTVNEVAVSPDGQVIASASKDRTVRLWNAATGELLHTLQGHTQEVHSVIFFPNGGCLASGSSDGTLRIWQVKTGTLQHTLTGHINSVNSVAIHHSGKLLASASADKTIKLWTQPR